MFTGRSRLARNLLQDVIRRWYARSPAIVETCAGLAANAERTAKVLESFVANSNYHTITKNTTLRAHIQTNVRLFPLPHLCLPTFPHRHCEIPTRSQHLVRSSSIFFCL